MHLSLFFLLICAFDFHSDLSLNQLGLGRKEPKFSLTEIERFPISWTETTKKSFSISENHKGLCKRHSSASSSSATDLAVPGRGGERKSSACGWRAPNSELGLGCGEGGFSLGTEVGVCCLWMALGHRGGQLWSNVVLLGWEAPERSLSTEQLWQEGFWHKKWRQESKTSWWVLGEVARVKCSRFL